MINIPIFSTFRLDNNSQRELDNISSTFSTFNNDLDDINMKSISFLETLKNISNISDFDAKADFVISVEDPDNVLEKVEKLEKQNIPALTNQSTTASSSDTPIVLQASAIAASVTAGAALGSAIGTIFPGPGNVAGGLLGAAIGAFWGTIVTLMIMESEQAAKELETLNVDVPLTDPDFLKQSNVTENISSNFSDLKEQTDLVGESQEQLKQRVDNANKSIESTGVTTENTVESYKNASEAVGGLGSEAESATEKGIEPLSIKAQELTNNLEGVDGQVEQAKETLGNLEGTMGNVVEETSTLNQANNNLAGSEQQVVQAVDDASASMEGAQGATKEFAEETQQASAVLDGLTVFAADVAANINDAFSDLIFNSMKGNFDSLGDLWKNALDSMLEALSQFLATVISNPIRLSLEAFLGGGSGVGGGGVGGVLGNLGGLGGSFKSLGSLFGIGKGIGGFDTSGASPIAGFAFDGINEALNLSGQGLFSTIGSAIPAIGTIVAALGAAIPIISNLFKKSPRLDIDIGVIKNDIGKRAATVEEFLDPALLDEVVNISVKRKAGLGLGGDDPIKEAISDVITASIETIQSIINQLPADLAAQLNETLLNADIDIESTIKGDKLLEFDETKKIAEKFQDFLEKDLPARFFASIRESFFDPALQSLGVTAEASQGFIDQFLEDLQGANREQRGVIGQEFIESFQTLVDAFNVLNDNGVDSIGATVNQVKNLSNTLGFDAVPSIDELDRGLEELINAAELDPELIQDFLDLRAAILQVQSAILSSISSIIGNISQLNSTIVSLGGSAVNLTGFINQGLDASLGLLGQEGLSLDDREALLDQSLGFANQLLAEEQAIFQRQQEAAQRAAEARAESQRRAVQAQIEGLEREKELISENFDRRIEALQKELQIAQEFERLTESIRNTLESIIFSSQSVLTPIEQVGLAQSDITRLQGELAGTGDLERQAEIAGQLEEAFDRLFGLAGDAFGVNSPEFVAIFDQVTGGLEGLAELTENSSRSVEEINAEIESLNLQRNQILETMDQRIDAAQERLASIQTQNVEATFQASDRVREVFELIRDEYIALYEERMAQLEEVTELGFEEELDALNSIANFSRSIAEFSESASNSALQAVEISDEQLVVLRSMEGILSGARSFRRGSGGIVDFGRGTLAFLHGREAVVPESQITPFDEFRRELGGFGEMNVNLNVNVNGGSDAAVQTVSTEIENMLVRSIRQGGKLRSAIQEAGARRIN